MKNAIITGPTGAIGIALINELINNNISVYAICRKDSLRRENIPVHPLVTIVDCDLEYLLQLHEYIPTQCDIFYHLGWAGTIGDIRNNAEVQLKNIQYTLDAVEVAHLLGCKKFIGAGSQAEYGRVEGKISPTTPTFPENGYGIAKLCAGQLSRIRCSQLNIEHIWTRILSIYGPYDGPNTMISSTIRQLLQGEIPSLTEGIQKWDYLYSKDAGQALYLLGCKGISGKTYCIGSGTTKELKHYITTLRDCINPNLELGFGKVPYGEFQVMHLEADISDLQQDTGFLSKYTFEEGIKETIQWYKEHEIVS